MQEMNEKSISKFDLHKHEIRIINKIKNLRNHAFIRVVKSRKATHTLLNNRIIIIALSMHITFL